eukprot:scaffold22008_cov62-Isochrysis_galbana.AAC.1
MQQGGRPRCRTGRRRKGALHPQPWGAGGATQKDSTPIYLLTATAHHSDRWTVALGGASPFFSPPPGIMPRYISSPDGPPLGLVDIGVGGGEAGVRIDGGGVREEDEDGGGED